MVTELGKVGASPCNELIYSTLKAKWGYKSIYLFHSQSGDGGDPIGALVQDSHGNLFGVTVGSSTCSGCGTIFEIVPSKKTETVLWNFCQQQNCTDGNYPDAGLTLDSNGNLFGTTLHGGKNGDFGVVFEFSGGAYSVLYNFCNVAGCQDGDVAVGGVVLDSSGDIFGTAASGGTDSSGVVYELIGGAAARH